MEKTTGNGKSEKAVINGRGIAHRHLTALERACLVIEVCEGRRPYKPSKKGLAAELGACMTYVMKAQRLPREERERILADKTDSAEFRALLKPAVKLLPPPARIDDEALAAIIRQVGVERALQTAVAVEAETYSEAAE